MDGFRLTVAHGSLTPYERFLMDEPLGTVRLYGFLLLEDHRAKEFDG